MRCFDKLGRSLNIENAIPNILVNLLSLVGKTGASLLGVGVERCEGRFDAGAAVELVGPDGVPFAKGIAGAGADELTGRPRGLEAVHRDKLVLY